MDLMIPQLQPAGGEFIEDFRVMADDYDCGTAIAKLSQHLHGPFAAFAIEVCSGLIEQQDLRITQARTRQGDALFLPTRQGRGWL